jgi:hypothetical protein
LNSIKKGFKPQTLLIIDKEGNTLSNKESRGDQNIMRSTLNCKIEQTVTVEKSGHCAHKLQNHILNQKNERAQEGHLWTHLKNMGGRDHTTWVAMWHKMSDSYERGHDDVW